MNYNWLLIKEPLLNWYKEEHRKLPWREDVTPYSVWISEIMLQQTRVEAVKDYYHRFISQIPDVYALANIQEQQLLKLWEGLGYYNRARNLKKAAQIIVDQYHGLFPYDYDEVKSLPGIGEYTAGAICSICYQQPTPAIDGNVLRVMSRLLEWDAVIDDIKTKNNARQQLITLYQTGDCDALTQAFMELGAMICRPNGTPKCDECPLVVSCNARNNNTVMDFPRRKEKKQRRLIEKTVFILHVNQYYGIRKRSLDGLLANMWEFYNVDKDLNTQQALDYITQLGFHPIEIEKVIPYSHIFSHVEWKMKGYYISCSDKNNLLQWIDEIDLEKDYALPTAFKYFLKKE